jgi:excisionase family DNA binding protein
MAAPEPLLTPAEAAAYLRLEEHTLANWCWRGEGPPYVRIDRRVRYRREDLEAWVQAQWRVHTSAPAPPPA